MKKLLNVMLWILLLGVSQGVFSAEKPTAGPVAKPVNMLSIPGPVTLTTLGTISAVDTKALTLKLATADGKSLDISLKGTTVWKSGKRIALTDLKVGDKAKVLHKNVNGADVARTIIIS